MRDSLRRRPFLAAAVIWALLLVIVQALVGALDGVERHTWPQWVLLAALLYAAAGIALVPRSARARRSADVPPETLFALAAAPVIACSGLAFAGAPVWSIWATWCGSGVLLAEAAVVVVVTMPREDGGQG